MWWQLSVMAAMGCICVVSPLLLECRFVVDAERGLIVSNRHVVTTGPVTAEAVFADHEEVPVKPVYRCVRIHVCLFVRRCPSNQCTGACACASTCLCVDWRYAGTCARGIVVLLPRAQPLGCFKLVRVEPPSPLPHKQSQTMHH